MRKTDKKMTDQTSKCPATFCGSFEKVADPVQDIEKNDDCVFSAGATVGLLADPQPGQKVGQITEKMPEFIPPAKVADLTGDSLTTVKRDCRYGKYPHATKAKINGVEAWQIPVSSLPAAAQKKLKAELQSQLQAQTADVPAMAPAADADFGPLWQAWQQAGEPARQRAMQAVAALDSFDQLRASGASIGTAEAHIKQQFGISKPTLWRYRQAVADAPRSHWAALLLPQYNHAGRPPAEFTDEAYQYILGRMLNTSKTPLAVVLNEARKQAAQQGWTIPSTDAVRHRLAQEPAWLWTLGREGAKALERNYPAMERDAASLGIHERWESDGRKADVWCVWPDGTRERPVLMIWRDVRTRMVLAVRGALSENTALVLDAFGAALQRTGTAPEKVQLDNGRAYASKAATGGQKNRYRFTIQPDEQPGVITLVGAKVDWAPPGRGQIKLIESFWKQFAAHVDKRDEFEGCYCGNGPGAKPENFCRDNAVPIAQYAAAVARWLHWYNTEHRHTGSGMNGRTPLEVYTELTAQAGKRMPVDPAHIQMCFSAMALVKPSKQDHAYRLKIPGFGECRYYSAEIAALPGSVHQRQHCLYYPQQLDSPPAEVQVWDGGKWLGNAQLLQAIPFLGAHEQAAQHVKDKQASLAQKKKCLKHAKQAAQQLSLTLPAPEPAALPQPDMALVIKGKAQTPLSGAAAMPIANVLDEETEKELAEKARKQLEKRRRANPALYQHSGE